MLCDRCGIETDHVFPVGAVTRLVERVNPRVSVPAFCWRCEEFTQMARVVVR